MAFFFAAFATLSAQYAYRIGLQASPTFTWLDTDDKFINANGQNLGLRFGVKFDYFLNPKFLAFSTGINLGLNQGGRLLHDFGGNLLKNSKFSSPFDSLPNGTNIRYHINYVEIPAGLHAHVEINPIRGYLEAGFNFSFPYNAAKGDITGSNIKLEGENIRKDVTSFQISWGLGGGIEYQIRGKSTGGGAALDFIAGVSYSQGVIDVTRNNGEKIVNGVPQEENSKATLSGLTIILVFMIGG